MNVPDVDENIWETSKENVQPLRSGRSAFYLKAALQPSEDDIKWLADERRKFEEDILTGENTDDPIEPWDKYLKWTKQNFLIGEERTSLENILRKFICKFLKNEEFKNDPRYIDAWIQLAETSDKPENIFSYMKAEGFGLKCAAFYVAWAEELEKYGNVKRVASIYELGEANNAQPFNLLQKMKNAFEMRCARETINSINQDSLVKSPISEIRPLNNLAAKKQLPFSVKNDLSNLSGNITTGQVKNDLSNLSGNITTGNQKSNLTIFEDIDSTTSQPVGKWAEFPDSVKANKENSVLKPSKWKIPLDSRQIRQSRYQSGRNFEIFVEAKHSLASAPSRLMANPQPGTLKPCNTQLEDEFGIFKEDVISAPPSARKVSKTVERVLSESKRVITSMPILEQVLSDCNLENDKNIVRQYPYDKIYSVLGEVQLEEIIAAGKRKFIRKSLG